MKLEMISNDIAFKTHKYSSSRGDFYMVDGKLPLRIAYDSNVRIKEMIDLIVTKTLKSFNTQINVMTGDTIKTTMYQCNINKAQLDIIKDEPDHVKGLLSLLKLRSNDFQAAISEAKAIEVVKYKSPRVDLTTKNSVGTFSLAITFYM